ncbi:MAG: cytochrome P450, partial [Microscillaceae bacterium]|nr:cytochrome P450 [Microscillaceae bacterium]
MFKVVDDIIAERKQYPEKYQHNTDFMSLMLNATDLATGEKLDDANIRFQIITFLIAGHETTSGLLSFAFYYLMTHPEVMQKAYAEVDAVLGGDLSTKPSYKEVMDLKYIQQILFESLRLWPTAPAFSVFATQDTLLGGKYPVKKRQPFIILLPKLHRDLAVWPQ